MPASADEGKQKPNTSRKGAFLASNQFFTARSLAPGSETTVFTAAWVPPYSRRSAAAIASAKLPGGKVIPETDRIIRSFFVNDIRDLPRVASTDSPALLSGHTYQLCALQTGERRDACGT